MKTEGSTVPSARMKSTVPWAFHPGYAMPLMLFVMARLSSRPRSSSGSETVMDRRCLSTVCPIRRAIECRSAVSWLSGAMPHDRRSPRTAADRPSKRHNAKKADQYRMARGWLVLLVGEVVHHQLFHLDMG